MGSGKVARGGRNKMAVVVSKVVERGAKWPSSVPRFRPYSVFRREEKVGGF